MHHDLPDTLTDTAGLVEQLALLYEASIAHGDLFETGEWDIRLNAPLASRTALGLMLIGKDAICKRVISSVALGQ